MRGSIREKGTEHVETQGKTRVTAILVCPGLACS